VEVGVEIDVGIYAPLCLLLSLYASPLDKKPLALWRKAVPEVSMSFPPPLDPHEYISETYPRRLVELYRWLGFVGLANARNRRHNGRRAMHAAPWTYWMEHRRTVHMDASAGRIPQHQRETPFLLRLSWQEVSPHK